MVLVTVSTEQMSAGILSSEAGFQIHSATQGVDFVQTIQTVVFSPGMVNVYVYVCLLFLLLLDFTYRVILYSSFIQQKLTDTLVLPI